MTIDTWHPDDKGWWLVVTVSKPGFTKAVFDSYTKTFFSTTGRSATAQFIDWWDNLNPESFTRKVAVVHVHWCIDSGNELKGMEDFPDSADELVSRIDHAK